MDVKSHSQQAQPSSAPSEEAIPTHSPEAPVQAEEASGAGLEQRAAEAITSPWKIQVYTGDGKGKTTSAVGLTVRALGYGLKVAFVQFDKGFHGEEHYSERNILRQLPGLELFPTGCERMRPGQPFRFGVLPEDLAEAQRGLALVHALIAQPRHDLVVLDEVLATIQYHLLKRQEVMEILDRYEAAGRPFELVLTGRRAPQEVMARADLVSEVQAVKHYFSQNLGARPGIEY